MTDGVTKKTRPSLLPNLACSAGTGETRRRGSQVSKSNMEVIVGTYEQVLVGFDVLRGDDELEVIYTSLEQDTEQFSFKII